MTDITYISTLEGFAYLAIVIDRYSRRVVGWSEMNLFSQIIIIAVVAWVTGCAIFGLDLIPTLTGVVIIALLRPFYDRVRGE